MTLDALLMELEDAVADLHAEINSVSQLDGPTAFRAIGQCYEVMDAASALMQSLEAIELEEE